MYILLVIVDRYCRLRFQKNPSRLIFKYAFQARTLITDASQPGNLQRALKLQLEAFWGNHNRKILALGGALVVYALWYDLLLSCLQEKIDNHKVLSLAGKPVIDVGCTRKTHAREGEESQVASGAPLQNGCTAEAVLKICAACRRSLFGFASMFFKLSETMADFGFLVGGMLCTLSRLH